VRRLLVLLAASIAVFGQQYRGTFSGMVTDPQGAAVAKVKVIATETQTGVITSAESGETGAYTLPFLSPGQYEISAEAPGFKKFTQQGITLSAGAHPVIDIRLELGAITESVTINSDAPILTTANASVGQVITTAQVADFPVNGRTPMMLDRLAMGVVSTYEPGPVRPFDNGAPNSISIGGAPSARNEVLMNGVPNAGFSNQMAYSPMQDAVTEVRVNAFEMDASIGHTMGGSVNMITKSGTNDLHGTAYIYNQTSVVDANSFFNNAKNVARPSYHQNQYGVTAGGPVYVPKVFNGRNRVFWYFGFEGMRDSDPANSPLETGNPENFTSVPTDAERKGDFSALLAVPGANNYTIYDPTTGVLSGTLVQRQPFPNNIIPSSRLNPVSQKFLQYFPMPNITGQPNGSLNYLINAIDSDTYDNELGRADFNLSDKNKLSFYAYHNSRGQNKNNFFGNDATGNFLYRINQGGSFDDVYTLGPTTVMDIRGSWTRYQEHHFSPADNVSPADLGFPDYLTKSAKTLMMPYVTFTSTTVSGGSRAGFEPLGYNGDGTNYSDIIQLYGTLVKIRGNHTLKVGGDLREYRWSGYTYGNPSGTFTFCCNASNTSGTSASTLNWTTNPAGNNSNSPFGQDFANFMLGLPSSGSIDNNASSSEHNRYMSWFVNDDWRVKSNLTLNFGLRWEHDFPATERWNRAVSGFDPAATNAVSAAAAAAYSATPQSILPANQFKALGGLTFPTSGNTGMYRTNSSIFSPRFGFAWTPSAMGGKTVIRGGFGVFVDPVGLTSSGMQNLQYGFSQQTVLPTSSTLTWPPQATLSDPFPNGFVVPAGSSKGASTYLGQAIQFYSTQMRNAYSVRWTFSVQRQLPGQMVLELAYVGNHGVHLPINTQLDYLPRQYLSTSLVRDNATNTLLTGNVANPFKGLIPAVSSMNGSNIALQQLLIPFPQFPVGSGTSNGIIMQQNPAGSSYYQSLDVRLEKRLAHGLTLLNNFVWSSLISRVGYLNDSDPGPYKTVDSGSSRPLSEVLAFTYTLPIGQGMAVNLQRRWLNFVAGGWRLSNILQLESGPVLNWGNYIYYGGPLNLNPHQPNGTAFDITQFERASANQLTSSSNLRYFANQYGNLRRDYTNEIDTSLDKDFHLTEQKYFEVRLEAFNVTNRVTFGNPNTTATNSAFGTIGSQANTPRRIETSLRLVF
jgi:hypothetical protein